MGGFGGKRPVRFPTMALGADIFAPACGPQRDDRPQHFGGSRFASKSPRGSKVPRLESIPLDHVTEDHLQALIDDKVPESRNLEFKQAGVGGSDNEKREFLKDATALANTAGGTLIYGMAESEGIALSLKALSVKSIDDEILRLQNILLNSVEPILHNVGMKGVPLASGGHVLLVKVPQSWRPPHRVVHSNVNRFFLRHSNGVFEPDTERLREVFNSSLDLERRLEDFREERLGRLEQGQRGLALIGPGKLLIQAVSLSRGQKDYIIPTVQECNSDFLPPLASSTTHRYNFDGLIIHTPLIDGGQTAAYTQIFRDWKIEMARGGFIQPIDGFAVLRASLLVGSILGAVERSIKGMLKHGGMGPFAVMVTVLDLAGSVLGHNPGGFLGDDLIDRDKLKFPTLIIDGSITRAELQQELLPVWDGLWQAYDRQNCSAVRDNNGEWKGIPVGWIQQGAGR